MCYIIVTEHALVPPVAAHALDHAGMVQGVRINNQPGKQLGQRAKCCVIGDIGAGEHQRGLFAMQPGHEAEPG